MIDCARHAALAVNMDIQVEKHSDLCVFEPGLVSVYQVPEQPKAKKRHLSLGKQKANTAKQTEERNKKIMLGLFVEQKNFRFYSAMASPAP